MPPPVSLEDGERVRFLGLDTPETAHQAGRRGRLLEQDGFYQVRVLPGETA